MKVHVRELRSIICSNCGILFFVLFKWAKGKHDAVGTDRNWKCPNGCARCFKETSSPDDEQVIIEFDAQNDTRLISVENK